jgi:hypothetical protein
MFVHGGVVHLLFNMVGLKSFGDNTLVYLGTRRFLGLYFVAGVAGAATQVAYQRLVGATRWPARHVVHRDTACLGASGAVLGLMAYNVCLAPRAEVLFGLVPVKNWVFCQPLWPTLGGACTRAARWACPPPQRPTRRTWGRGHRDRLLCVAGCGRCTKRALLRWGPGWAGWGGGGAEAAEGCCYSVPPCGAAQSGPGTVILNMNHIPDS